MKPTWWLSKVNENLVPVRGWATVFRNGDSDREPLYTTDQLREAQVKVLREAADAISKGMAPNKAREMIRRMADELEKQK